MRRGFTIIEILITMLVLAACFVALFMVFSGGARQAVASRNRTVAMLWAQSLLEEIRAHPYGTPEPASWKVEQPAPVRVWVEGRPQDMTFTQKITYANASFIGKSSQDTDEITLTISWREASAQGDGIESLTVKTAVWR
ncbi:MAG TPA: prepilin-type N-terminal cleavage/methylation domain-containing protein [Candidatus Nitrosotenuis sp.]|jgi:prepilin-type N-terminal cleavage/methylation domain-containing protein|nr:prepilin-type N-terminal cleavage/methylation domain-containing protein [Candidatus Nitrosotenuis sp.]